MNKNQNPPYQHFSTPYDRYIEYRAYGHLKELFVAKLHAQNVQRPSIHRCELLLNNAYAEIKESITNPEILATDDMSTIYNKKREIEDNTIYYFMIQDAYAAYMNALFALSRPTLLQVEKHLENVLDTIIAKLLEL